MVKPKKLSLSIVTLLIVNTNVWLETFNSFECKAQTQGEKKKQAMPLPFLQARDLDGNSKEIRFDNASQPTVFYVFSPTCKWCGLNMENVKTLQRLRGKSYRFIGLSLADLKLKEYVGKYNLNFPVYKNLLVESIDGVALGSTPQTIVVSSKGKVLRNWIGAYDKSLRSEIGAYFKIQLSELTQIDQVDMSKTSPPNCTYCIREGLLYSPGSVENNNSQKIRCKDNGQWTKPY